MIDFQIIFLSIIQRDFELILADVTEKLQRACQKAGSFNHISQKHLQKKKRCICIVGKLVLGWIRCLGFGLFAGWGTKRHEKVGEGLIFFFQHRPREKTWLQNKIAALP
jgi:hypothetical protein